MIDKILSYWYDWGAFLGFLITAGVLVYVIIDIKERFSFLQPYLHIIAIYFGLCLLVVPSLMLRLTTNSGPVGALNFAFIRTQPRVLSFAYLGICSTLLSLVALFGYVYWRFPNHNTPRPRTVFERDNSQGNLAFEQLPPPVSNEFGSTDDPIGLKNSFGNVSLGNPVAHIVVQDSINQQAADWPLHVGFQGEFGRAPELALTLSDGTVSRRHAELSYEDGGFLLRDLQSSSGTFVNGQRVQQHRLKNNDSIQLGRVQMTFRVT